MHNLLRKNSSTITHHKCLQHTNQKSANELGPTVFSQGKKLLLVKGLSEIGVGKGALSLRFSSTTLTTGKMLPKSSRIPRALFKPLLESRQYFNSEHFSLRVASSDTVRIAISVSKKISKSAVVRNKIRRRAYSVFRNTISTLKPGLYLVVAKQNAQKMKGKDLENELKLLVVSCRL